MLLLSETLMEIERDACRHIVCLYSCVTSLDREETGNLSWENILQILELDKFHTDQSSFQMEKVNFFGFITTLIDL